jgi:hypothetical protein
MHKHPIMEIDARVAVDMSYLRQSKISLQLGERPSIWGRMAFRAHPCSSVELSSVFVWTFRKELELRLLLFGYLPTRKEGHRLSPPNAY